MVLGCSGHSPRIPPTDRSLAGGVGALHFDLGRSCPGWACGIGHGRRKAALGCGGRWRWIWSLPRDQGASLRGVSGCRFWVSVEACVSLLCGMATFALGVGVPGLCGVGTVRGVRASGLAL